MIPVSQVSIPLFFHHTNTTTITGSFSEDILYCCIYTVFSHTVPTNTISSALGQIADRALIFYYYFYHYMMPLADTNQGAFLLLCSQRKSTKSEDTNTYHTYVIQQCDTETKSVQTCCWGLYLLKREFCCNHITAASSSGACDFALSDAFEL